MRLLVINFTGDVREAYHRLASGGAETYYAQRYYIDGYAALLSKAREVCVLACVGEHAYDEVLPSGVRAIGGGFKQLRDTRRIFELIRSIDPTHVVVCTPDWRLVRWLALQNFRCAACFSGSIPDENQRSLLRRTLTRARNAQLAFCLNRKRFEWVGSYGLASSRRLAAAGVNPSKIVPWDLLMDSNSGSMPAKTLRRVDDYELCYVGTIQEGKGVGDLLDAMALLVREGFGVRATIVGSDSDKLVAERVARHGLQQRVTLPGILPTAQIEPLMQRCDLVLVPSRPDYPEGFPLVIHHALRSRTPIVASNHPMFLTHLKHGESAMLFPAGDAEAMAQTIRSLLSDAETYDRLSSASDATWMQMRVPGKWFDLVGRWLSDSPADRRWRSSLSLAAK